MIPAIAAAASRILSGFVLPCRSISKTEDKHANDKELVKVLQNHKQDLGHIVVSEWTVLRVRQGIGENIECEVDVGLEKKMFTNDSSQHHQLQFS